MRGSQVGELHRRVMLKQRSLAFILILLLITMPWMAMLESEEDELKETNILSSGTLNGWPDVPTWRIGDKYTYETQFDVQQLIQQANVSASLNTLTGDTTYEVVDILFITIDGVQTLAYKMDVDGDFSYGNSGATLEGVSGKLLSDQLESVHSQVIYVSNKSEISTELIPFLKRNDLVVTMGAGDIYSVSKELYARLNSITIS